MLVTGIIESHPNYSPTYLKEDVSAIEILEGIVEKFYFKNFNV